MEIIDDTTLIRKMADQQLSEDEINTLAKKKYTILVYVPRNFDGTWSLQSWNNQYIVAQPDQLQFNDTIYFAHLKNGFYEVVRKSIFLPQKGNIIVLGMIPVRWEYFIPFRNLPNAFVDHEHAEKKVMLAERRTDLDVKSSISNSVFYLERREEQETAIIGWLTISFIITGILMLLYFFQQVAHDIAKDYGLWRAIMFLLTAVFIMRGATYLFPTMLNLRRLELF